MKIKPLFLAGLVALGGAATVQAADAVYSVNVVGYASVDVPEGFSMIANPLDAGDNSLANVMPSPPQFTTVYKFDTIQGAFSGISFFNNGSWSNGALTLAPGEGGFIAANEAFTVTFSGEVLQGELSNPLSAGFSIISSQVPQAGSLSSLGYTPAQFDTVYKYDNAISNYTITFYNNGSWNNGEPSLAIGEAFFLAKQNAGSWDRTFTTSTDE